AGPIARRVTDLREVFLAMQDAPSPRAEDRRASKWRCVVLEDFFAMAEESARDGASKAVDALQKMGASISRQTLPIPLSTVLQAHRRIMAAEAAAYHRPWFADHRHQYGPHVRSLIEEGISL